MSVENTYSHTGAVRSQSRSRKHRVPNRLSHANSKRSNRHQPGTAFSVYRFHHTVDVLRFSLLLECATRATHGHRPRASRSRITMVAVATRRASAIKTRRRVDCILWFCFHSLFMNHKNMMHADDANGIHPASVSRLQCTQTSSLMPAKGSCATARTKGTNLHKR